MRRARRNRSGTNVVILLHICFVPFGFFMLFVVMVMNVGGRWEGGEGGVTKGGGGRIPAAGAAQLTFVILCVVHDVEVAHFVFTVWTAEGRRRGGKRRGGGRREGGGKREGGRRGEGRREGGRRGGGRRGEGGRRGAEGGEEGEEGEEEKGGKDGEGKKKGLVNSHTF